MGVVLMNLEEVLDDLERVGVHKDWDLFLGVLVSENLAE